jgi:hypothetical protein
MHGLAVADVDGVDEQHEANEAERLNEEGRACDDAGDVEGAERAYRSALALAPDWFAPAYNLGLIYKYQGRWAESLQLNLRAAELAPDHQGSWWNGGIAATALGQWAEARRCWAGCGIPDPGGEDPPDYRIGRCAFRLNPNGEGEVVWGRRIDPARARLLSIPLPKSNFRWSDIVLHDGAPEGYRIVNGVKCPVFNVLQRLMPSGMRTFIIELASVDGEALASLETIATEMGGAAEDWGTSTYVLCRECSLGVPHDHPDEDAAPAHPHCGLAAPGPEIARAIIDRWLETNTIADLVTWYESESTAPPGR